MIEVIEGDVMNFIIIVDKASGNESVGTMWKETYVFDSTATLKEVFEAIYNEEFDSHLSYTKEQITLTIPH